MADNVIRIVDGARTWNRDPRSRLSVRVDWSAWLANEGTTITASVWSVVDPATTPIVVDSPAVSGDGLQTTAFVSGGTAGTWATLRNTITCANGQIESRSMRVRSLDR